MFALYKKELRSLWPFLMLTFLLMSGDLLYRPFTERLDEQTWESIASYLRPGDSEGFGWILAVLAISLAYSAFPREHDDKTIRFLHALPIRRPWIFLSKAAAGITILWVGVLLLFLSDTAQSVWNTQSFGGSHWRVDLALMHVALQAAFCVILYGHGLLASVLRRFGLLPYVLLMVVASILEDVFAPAAWINPTELLTARYEGSELVISWVPWGMHSLVAALAFATAYAAWMGPAEGIGRGLSRARASLVGRLAFGCGSGVVVLMVIGLAVAVSEVDVPRSAPDPDASARETVSIETRRRETRRYAFTYPVSHEDRALALIGEADALHAAVQQRLGADEGPSLLADLTEESSEHLGIASWTHLRVGLVGETDPVRLRHTFAHETVHAFQHRLSDLRQSDAARSTRFFAEGSAEFIGFLVAPNPEAHRHARVVAAASWERHRMRTSDLLDGDRLQERFDTTLVYSLGERWSAALTAACGEHAVGDALRAMGRDDAPRDLPPRAFWEDTLHAAECDLETVDATFAQLMEEETASLADPIARLPRLGGGVSARDGASIVIVALLDRTPAPTQRFYVRLRADTDASDTETVLVRGELDSSPSESGVAPRVSFRVSRALIPARRFQLQLSVMEEGSPWPFAEAWQWATAP